MKRATPPIPFAGALLDEERHVCAFFHDEEEEYRVLLPFIKEGFDRGEKAVHVVNPHQRAGHLDRLAGAGIDVAAARSREQLDLRGNTETYLHDGRFDSSRMLESFEQMVTDNAQGPYPVSRIVCRMDWAAEGQSHIEDLVEFESLVNHVWQRHDDAVICTYYLDKFGGDTVIDVMRTHPMVIIGGILQHNPFFVPPEEFVREFRERNARRMRHSA